MEFEALLKKRRMTRSFLDERISDEVLGKVVRAALQGPSAGFAQGVEFVVVKTPLAREHFWSCVTTPGWLDSSNNHKGLDYAQAVIVVLANKQRYIRRYQTKDKSYSGWDSEESWPTPYWYVDAGAAVMLALLSAANCGLGALFFSIDRGFSQLRSFFEIPEELLFVGAIAIGVPTTSEPSGSSRVVGRRPFDESVRVF